MVSRKYSNYGAISVDLAAPGVGIYSCVPGNSYEVNYRLPLVNSSNNKLFICLKKVIYKMRRWIRLFLMVFLLFFISTKLD